MKVKGEKSSISVRLAICDDMPVIGGQIERIILSMQMPNLEIEVYESGEQLLREWDRGEQYQILFLDIEMPGMDGITLAKEIRKRDQNALILFVSSHHEYVFDTFTVEPFRFVRKPICEDEIKEDMYAAWNRLEKYRKYFYFQISKTQYQVSYDEINYFEGNGRKIILYTASENYEFYGKIADVMQNLDHHIFCQIHSSYIVNMNKIRSISHHQVILADHTALPVSKARKDDLYRSHMDFMFKKAGVK